METEASLRGYTSKRELKRRRARLAGLASGRKRRQLARPRNRRVRQRELMLHTPIAQAPFSEFAERFERMQEAKGIRVSERGLRTVWAVYCARFSAYRVKNQGFCTTNAQGARALCKRGRPRCARTIRRAHKQLAEMGYLHAHHDRRGGARAGNKDRLRINFMPSFVPPPSAAAATGASRPSAAASHDSDSDGCAVRGHGPAPPGLSAPATPAGAGCAGGQRQHREREGASAVEAVEFIQLQLELPAGRRAGSASTAVLESKLAEWMGRL